MNAPNNIDKLNIATAVDVIDAAGGNVGSLCRALERLGVEYRRVNASNRKLGDRPIILPGVGAFGAVMDNLVNSQLVDPIKEAIAKGVPFLGICVGLQVLFESSEETPGVAGLSILPGKVVRFTEGKIPQIGWNSVESTSSEWPSGFVYFVNSYFAEPAQPDAVLFKSEYFQTFCAAVQKENITAFQFHPEKSGDYGMTLLETWLAKAKINEAKLLVERS
ncbi:MAG: imidazole glycerol phosphate synthase subunit HisH [Candidatus Melainabacteria bacterium]|nr:imidazole glycerol phosphate synthase subunit HisH [Candidatus Melainabacteria bacterium]